MLNQYTEDHREYLKRELAKRIRRRPLYSQRALARDLGLAPSTLTDFLKGRIGFSEGRVSQISKNLGLSKEQKEHWMDLIHTKFSRNPELRKESSLKVKARIESEKNAITLDEFKTISEWHHFAFLELIEMNPKKYSDLKVSAQSLGISMKEMKSAAHRLTELKLISFDGAGKIYVVDPSTHVGNRAPSEAIRHFHSQILKKAAEALETQSVERRYYSSTFVGVPKEQVPVILEDLKSMAYKILEPYLAQSQNQPKEKLYCLSLQFFDLLNEKGPPNEK